MFAAQVSVDAACCSVSLLKVAVQGIRGWPWHECLSAQRLANSWETEHPLESELNNLGRVVSEADVRFTVVRTSIRNICGKRLKIVQVQVVQVHGVLPCLAVS